MTPPATHYDCQGTPLLVDDCVSPVDYPGRHTDAPVYTVAHRCHGSNTVVLRRADGSTLYMNAADLIYLPETTRAAHEAAGKTLYHNDNAPSPR